VADLFVHFLVTRHGLAAVLQPNSVGFEGLRCYFLDRVGLREVAGRRCSREISAGIDVSTPMT
jgi:hypothetical protein